MDRQNLIDFETVDEPLERWLPITGWPGYDVSDWGRVQSYWGAGGRGEHGKKAIGLTPKLIGGYIEQSGHTSVLLYRNQSTEKRRVKIHTLVLEAFVGPRPKGKWGCHNDGNPANNRLENLRWDTPQSNSLDALRHGSAATSLMEADIPTICERIEAGESDTAIGRLWNVSGVTIGGIRSGRIWSHLTENRPGWPLLTEMQCANGEPVRVPDNLARTAKELFRPLPGWPPYRMSNRGRVQSCLEYGSPTLTDRWHDRTPVKDKDGYLIFWARKEGDKPRMLKVHRCVLLAFAGPAPSGFIGCHDDGNRSNNNAWNLRWDTSKRNVADREQKRRA